LPEQGNSRLLSDEAGHPCRIALDTESGQFSYGIGYDCGAILDNQQLEQTRILLEDVGVSPKQVVVDLGYRGVDGDNPSVEIIHRGRYKSLTRQQRRWLMRRQAVEPAIGHLKSSEPPFEQRSPRRSVGGG